MALEQTLLSTSNLVFSIPQKILTNVQFPFVSLSQNPLTKQCWFGHERPLKLRLKYSIDYKDYNAVAYSKPPKIPWSKELTNTVQLIGVVGTPVEIKHLPSGKVLAWTRLAVRKSATDTSWINLTFWDELAQVASQYVEKGHEIYVSGRLVSDVVESDDGKQQIYYKVVVQQLNFVERSSSSVALYDRDSNFTAAGKKYGNNTGNSTGSNEELWQAFFANPVDWWDNRKNKKNPKYPDFKHKDTGEALWVQGRYNPHWVKSQLAILDTRMGSLRDVDTRTRTDRAVMLDETVDYVKFLRLQVTVLSMSRLGGSGAVAPLVTDIPLSSVEDEAGEGGRNQPDWEKWSNDGTERQFAKLMGENVGAAMQFLQSKALCIMAISLATAIYHSQPPESPNLVKPETNPPS